MRVLAMLLLLSSPAFAQEEAAPAAPSIEDLRKEYEKIREAVFSSRARAASVGDTIYATNMEV